MFPFIFANVSDSFSSMKDFAIYVGFYRLSVNFARPLYEVSYYQVSNRRIVPFVLLALLFLQAGWLVGGLAQNSWMFASSRALLGLGSAGVIAGSSLLPWPLGYREKGQCHKRYLKVLSIVEWVSSLIGPL